MVSVAPAIIKRAGHSEPYDEAKLHASVIAAALSVRALEGEAELFARRVVHAIRAWLDDKTEVTSYEIHQRAAGLLYGLHADAAYAYDSLDTTL